MKKHKLSKLGIILLILCVGFFFMATGCSKKQVQQEQPVVGAQQGQQAQAAPAQPVEQAAAPQPAAEVKAPAAAIEMADVRFDFDKSTLREGDRDVLKKHADWLQQNKEYNVVIEGNCDERGTTEYNLALGERRAVEAKKFLLGLGIEESRIKTISYGEERPLDPGHNEDAWSKNRRDRFVINLSK